jgi:hypothetical protein
MSFTNKNFCRSFTQTIGTNLVALSSQLCSEVIIVNKSGVPVEIYDQGFSASTFAMLLSANDTFTFRGITNSDQVSAKAVGGTGPIYYRTQHFSQFVQTV